MGPATVFSRSIRCVAQLYVQFMNGQVYKLLQQFIPRNKEQSAEECDATKAETCCQSQVQKTISPRPEQIWHVW